MATIKDVSEKAGVSQATVSRVLNGSDKVVESTCEKVMAAVEALGYRPNTLARAMASGRSGIVGMMVPELASPVYSPLMGEAEALLRKHSKQLIVASGHCDPKLEREAIDFLLQCRCDALILMAEAVSDEYLLDIAKANVEVVIVNRAVDGLESNCVSLDNIAGGKLATQFLIDAGHTHIGCITGPQFKPDARDRQSGFLQALRDHEIAYSADRITEGNYTEQSGYEGMKSLSSKGVSAVLCGNDEMAFGAIAYCRDHQIKVPEDVSIMGFDNLHFARYTYPALTTMHFPIDEMAISAAHLILNRCYNIDPTAPITRRYQPNIVERQSVNKSA
ncbi:LacI family DNA-binding transcriptional regulator [Echinimonas agarilytica]|uniref:LacI family DNA-binding transcriptional regulator n=1 Tax=Echinimonas agarilytica TaxID=1215918 RepID=A0AA42B8R9_9GAMM|nr:LacI family DNA-binding transcriptional regulator [Echinimonas agarilytica]MCM2680501.1 LacI family DNA-binding transcriptional regulator [Echinimonas agarilytica]